MPSRSGMLAALASLLMVIAAARIVATYSVFSQTFDEGLHVAAGMEWLDRGVYRLEVKHAPLARVAAAAGPYLDGLRSLGAPEKLSEGNAILHARGSYSRNLALARLGVLPFFVFATFLVWLWSRKLFGDIAAIISVAIFSTAPPVLAHGGLATTDMAVTATLLGALLSFVLWLDHPGVGRGLLLGVAVALAVLSKLSAVVLFPACAVAIVVTRWLIRRRAPPLPGDAGDGVKKTLVAAVLAGCVGLFVIWAGYRFSVGPRFGSYVDGGIPVPAPELLQGLRDVQDHNDDGHPAFLLGQHSMKGWWYYFPVALAIKTPIPFLLLTGIGLGAIIARARSRRDWHPLAPPVAAGIVLATSMAANINIGIRHVLPLYPLMAIVAGYGAVWHWNSGLIPKGARAVVVGLLLWQGVSSARSHPDYLPYFNALAGKHPEQLLVDSNLDWGQDLLRLADTVRARGITALSVAYFGSADIKQHALPGVRRLQEHERATGWIAASETELKGVYREGYSWLEDYEPVALVGKSIRLYYLPPE